MSSNCGSGPFYYIDNQRLYGGQILPYPAVMSIDWERIAPYSTGYGFQDPDDICYLPCHTTIICQILLEPNRA